MLKAVVFDFDGVIHDTFRITYNIVKKIYPDLSTKEYKDFFNGNVRKNKKANKSFLEKYFKCQNEEFKNLVMCRETREMLTSLSKKYSLFIISSNMELAMNDYLKNNHAKGLFTRVLGVETHTLKTKKFKILMKEYGLEKNEIIFVTDTLGDILEANEVGIHSLAVDFGFHDVSRLKKGKPVKIVSDYQEMIKVINSI
ncbi:hypothetical protein C0583_06940 [Candidatus Parcubacteria bacterium]|nr:MAG: hypothetical protein C0583_06940 [Candidatus Parcubacteria bacterium]